MKNFFTSKTSIKYLFPVVSVICLFLKPLNEVAPITDPSCSSLVPLRLYPHTNTQPKIGFKCQGFSYLALTIEAKEHKKYFGGIGLVSQSIINCNFSRTDLAKHTVADILFKLDGVGPVDNRPSTD